MSKGSSWQADGRSAGHEIPHHACDWKIYYCVHRVCYEVTRWSKLFQNGNFWVLAPFSLVTNISDESAASSLASTPNKEAECLSEMAVTTRNTVPYHNLIEQNLRFHRDKLVLIIGLDESRAHSKQCFLKIHFNIVVRTVCWYPKRSKILYIYGPLTSSTWDSFAANHNHFIISSRACLSKGTDHYVTTYQNQSS